MKASGYFISGTDTDVGKTYTTVKLLRQWQAEGLSVAAMKPVASGCVLTAEGELINDDVQRLVAVTGQTDLALMSPYRFQPPISPHLAARQAGVVVSIERIVNNCQQLRAQVQRVAVEGAGGWLAPLSDSLSMEDLACALGLPVILVVGVRLGCISHALLSARAIRAAGLPLAGWVANCLDPGMLVLEDNLVTLRQQLEAPCLLTLPYAPA